LLGSTDVDLLTSVDPMTVELPISCCGPLAAATLSDAEAESTAALFKALGTRGGTTRRLAFRTRSS